MIVFANIPEHVTCNHLELVKFAQPGLSTDFLVKLQVLKPERRVLEIVLESPLTDVYGFFELVFSLFEPRGIQEDGSVVLVVLHQVPQLHSCFLS